MTPTTTPTPARRAPEDETAKDRFSEALFYAIRAHAEPAFLREWQHDGPEMDIGSPQREAFDAIVDEVWGAISPPPPPRPDEVVVRREESYQAVQRVLRYVRLRRIICTSPKPFSELLDLADEASDALGQITDDDMALIAALTGQAGEDSP